MFERLTTSHNAFTARLIDGGVFRWVYNGTGQLHRLIQASF